MNAQEYILNIRPGYGYSQTVKVSQDDIGRPLEFHLYDGMDLLSITVGSVITIHATKPSGLGFTETCTWSGSTASISTTESMTQESGAFPAELVITSGGDVLGTANFTFCVERSPHQTGTTDGVAEDLQDIYEQLDDLKSELNGWSDDTKTALLNAFAHVAWTDEHGQDYYDALEEALYAEAPKTLVSISAVYTQSGNIYDTDSLDRLKTDLVVTATYDDSTTATVTAYTLSGTLEVGTSTITATYEGKTATFTVTVKSGFLYTPDKGLLSEQEYITKEVITAQSQFSESIDNSALRLYCPSVSPVAGRIAYKFAPLSFANTCKLTAEFKIINMSWVQPSNAHNGWVKFQTTKENASACSTALGFARDSSTTGTMYMRYEVSNSPSKEAVSVDEWHTLEVTNENDTQTIKLDGVTIANAVNSAGYSPSFGNYNSLVFDCGNTGANDIYIKKIELLCE